MRPLRLAAPLVIAASCPWPAAAEPSAFYAPAIPQPLHPGEIVGLLLQNDIHAPLPRRDVTFGEVFRAGQVPSGQALTALSNGQHLPAQIDPKTTWPDGSVRIAVVTIAVPPLRLGATLPLMLALDKSPPTPPVDLAPLAAPDTLVVDLTLHGPGAATTTRHYDLGALLQTTLAHPGASFWLRGPLATEARVQTPIAGSLRLVADLRRTAEGDTSADIQFDNDAAMQPEGGDVTYDVTIRRGAATVFSRQSLHQFQYQTWHTQLGASDITPITVVHDVPALARTGAILNYDLKVGASAAVIAANTALLNDPHTAILGPANVEQQMGTTGGRPDIGPQPLWNVLWLMTGRPDAAAYALSQADAAGSIPWHFYDPAAHTYVTTDSYPQLWADPRGGSSGTTALTQPRAGMDQTGWDIDGAHQPDLSYVPYLLTGRRYRLDQMEAQAVASILQTWPALRQDGQDIVANGQTQVRDQAWSLRQIVEAAFADPDSSKLQPYFRRVVDSNFHFLRDRTHAARQGEAHGWIEGDYGNTPNIMAPWQQDFVASTVILAAGMGVPSAKEFLDWESNFLTGRFLAADRGFDPHEGVTYNLVMGPPDRDAPLFQTWREIEAATAAAGKSNQGGFIKNTDVAYVTAARGILAGLVAVTGSPESKQAYAWLMANSPMVTPALQQKDPTFAIAP